MPKTRARVIDDDVIEVVVELLRQWSGKLTWDLLIARIKQAIGAEYTRQALANHEDLALAFTLRKRSLQKEGGLPAPSDSRIDVLQKTVARLKAENELLSIECNNYRAMFLVWTANAIKGGLTERMMNAPLLPAMRSSSDDQGLAFTLKTKGKKSKNG